MPIRHVLLVALLIAGLALFGWVYWSHHHAQSELKAALSLPNVQRHERGHWVRTKRGDPAFGYIREFTVLSAKDKVGAADLTSTVLVCAGPLGVASPFTHVVPLAELRDGTLGGMRSLVTPSKSSLNPNQCRAFNLQTPVLNLAGGGQVVGLALVGRQDTIDVWPFNR